MGTACSASKKKLPVPSTFQDVQSPKPPPSNNVNTIFNIVPTNTNNLSQFINENTQKIADKAPIPESPPKEEVQQRLSFSNPKNSLLQNENISPNHEPLPPPLFEEKQPEQEGQGWQEEGNGENEQMEKERNGGNEVQEEPRHLEEMNFNNEEGEGVEGGEMFQNEANEDQNQNYQEYVEQSVDDREYNEEEDDYNQDNYDYEDGGVSVPQMQHARKSIAGPVLMALKPENVNDFFVAPVLKEENEEDMNQEFKNVNNETAEHENNSPSEPDKENDHVSQVI